jgi:hypothetical protein
MAPEWVPAQNNGSLSGIMAGTASIIAQLHALCHEASAVARLEAVAGAEAFVRFSRTFIG